MEISWIHLILDADTDCYDEKYTRPVGYEFSGDREFRQEDYP